MSQQQNPNKTVTHVIYALYAFGLISGITPIVALIINYVKRDDVRGSWLESHFAWQMQTFWYTFAGVVVGLLATFILIGWVILAVVWVWYLYRIVKGWLSLVDEKPMSMTGGLL